MSLSIDLRWKLLFWRKFSSGIPRSMMPASPPYTYYACPCTDVAEDTTFERTVLVDSTLNSEEEEQDNESTFDPSKPRANHALSPLENLLFCNECHEIRCPRCYYEEVLYYYCPSCLMEIASTTVRTETNRCTRSCLQCPICFTSLLLQAFPVSASANSSSIIASEKASGSTSSREGGPFILSCPYCTWSTLEIGIKFDKNINIISQLSQIQRGKPSHADAQRQSQSSEDEVKSSKEDTNKGQYEILREFYCTSLAEANPTGPLGSLSSSFGLDSPSHLSRLLSAYGVGGLKKQRQKPTPMREAGMDSEGLLDDPLNAEDGIIDGMRTLGYDNLASTKQSSFQFSSLGTLSKTCASPRTVDQLLPIPLKLRSKRSKRCQQCRYHLLRPDDKRHSARYKLRLLALNFIVRITAAPLDPEKTNLQALKRGLPQQFIVTCKNPLFDPVKVKLGTPNVVPGASGSRATILCPQFDIGASTDVWDEALDSSTSKLNETAGASSSRGVAEAGKVWKKGRNWTSVVLEVVPGITASDEQTHTGTQQNEGKALEIPLLVRMEYFTDASAGSVPSGWESPESSPGYRSAKEERLSKELEFWVVVGLGRLATR